MLRENRFAFGLIARFAKKDRLDRDGRALRSLLEDSTHDGQNFLNLLAESASRLGRDHQNKPGRLGQIENRTLAFVEEFPAPRTD